MIIRRDCNLLFHYSHFMAEIKVMGHVPPDTDSVCSPIVYAWYLKQTGVDAKAVIAGKLNKETQFLLQHFNVPQPEMITEVNETDQLVLLDTNNPEELISGYEKATIIEVIDHHKLAGLTTPAPLRVTIRPYACVATVLFDMLDEKIAMQMPKDIAGLMLAAILSDTLKFTSPTTTDRDREAAKVIADHTGINVDELATQMFAAKSNLEGMSAYDILTSDHKNFKFGENTYKVAVLETTDPQQSLSRKAELLTEMQNIKTNENLAGVFFFVVDILKTEATLIVSDEELRVLAEKAFGQAWNEDTMYLPGVVSRKKQIIPPLEKAAQA
jgi:manganese-dependent inorganic pyrophosphatase